MVGFLLYHLPTVTGAPVEISRASFSLEFSTSLGVIKIVKNNSK